MATSTQAIEHLAERKCKITGRIHKIEGIEPLKNGFRQYFMLHIPEMKDEMTGKTLRKEQYYRIQIFSTQQTDKRFLTSANLRELKCCSVYLNSFHWIDPKEGLATGMRLNFIEWFKVEK